MKNLVYLLLILPIAFSRATAQEKGGKLEPVGSGIVDLGKYRAREVKTADFKIRNSGKDTVRIIKVHITCGCASAACDKAELNHGEMAGIRITTLPNSMFGKFDKQMFVESTAETNRFLALTIKGTAVPLVEIKPNDYIYAGRIDTNMEWSHSFEVSPTEQGVKLGEPDIKFNYPLEAKLTPLNNTGNSSYKLDVRLLSSPKPGDFHGTINLPVISPSNHPAISIGISGKIGPELIAVPGTFRFPVSDKEIVRTFHLKILGDSTVRLDPGQITLPEEKGVACTIKQSEDGKSISVTARFSPQFTRLLHSNGKTDIRFSLPNILPARVNCLPEN